MPRPSPWSDEELRAAVPGCSTMLAVCRALGVLPGGKTYDRIRQQVARMGLDGAHIPGMVRSGNRLGRTWTDEDLRHAVEHSWSVSGVIRELGYNASGGMHRFVSAHIRRLALDTSHFTGRAWMKGRRRPPDQVRRSLESILVAGSAYRSSGKLRERLIRAGLKDRRCERCGRDTWFGEPMPLELDHINGDPCDNRLENLRILCPNCHSLTETWCRPKDAPAYSNRQRDTA